MKPQKKYTEIHPAVSYSLELDLGHVAFSTIDEEVDPSRTLSLLRDLEDRGLNPRIFASLTYEFKGRSHFIRTELDRKRLENLALGNNSFEPARILDRQKIPKSKAEGILIDYDPY